MGQVPAAAHQELAPLYGPDSEAAGEGNQQWFATVSPTVRYVTMNTERATLPVIPGRSICERRSISRSTVRP